MNYKEFYDKMGEFADQIGLGIRHTTEDVFVYINLFPLEIEFGISHDELVSLLRDALSKCDKESKWVRFCWV